jgi:hypothetical protein
LGPVRLIRVLFAHIFLKLLKVCQAENGVHGDKCHKEESQRIEVPDMLSTEEFTGEKTRYEKPFQRSEKLRIHVKYGIEKITQ